MAPFCRTAAVVSGKGGVGKTVISANLADIIATVARVLLVDLDFANQGLTGLFIASIRPGCISSRELIERSEILSGDRITRLRENLYFLPAFDPSDEDRFTFRPADDAGVLAEVLAERLDDLKRACTAEFVILDCHGGLDTASYAAFASSDRTFVITEPDVVTFNGTLELFDFYINHIYSVSDQGSTRDIAKRPSPISLVINRVSGALKYDSIVALYNKELRENVPGLVDKMEEYIFLPTDQMLARSVSDHPLFVELLPESIFCQKLELVCRETFGVNPRIRGRSIFYRLLERKSVNKLRRYTRSMEEVRAQAVFAFIAIVEGGLLMAISTGIAVGFATFVAGDPASETVENLIKAHPAVFLFLNIAVGLLSFLAARVNFLIAGYYRDQLRYAVRLVRKARSQLNVTFLSRFVRFLAARLYLYGAALIFVLFGVFNIYGIIIYVK